MDRRLLERVAAIRDLGQRTYLHLHTSNATHHYQRQNTMAATMSAQFIHPNTPPKLVKKFKKAGSFHKLADEINVNVKYIHELITEGKEPNDTTPTLREVRHRLYLRKYKPRNRPKPPAPKHLIWWNNIGKEMRHFIVKLIYQRKEYYREHPERPGRNQP
jgi:hypothetical protein